MRSGGCSLLTATRFTSCGSRPCATQVRATFSRRAVRLAVIVFIREFLLRRRGGCGEIAPRDIGRRSPAFPVTPPYVRVRIRRFGGLSYLPPVNLGIPSESK